CCARIFICWVRSCQLLQSHLTGGNSEDEEDEDPEKAKLQKALQGTSSWPEKMEIVDRYGRCNLNGKTKCKVGRCCWPSWSQGGLEGSGDFAHKVSSIIYRQQAAMEGDFALWGPF